MADTNTNIIDAFEPVVITHPRTQLSVHVLPFGLIIHRILVNSGETTSDIIVGPESPKDHFTGGRRFFGTVIGRYANRLPAGRSKFGKDGNEGNVDLPEWSSPGVVNHGGPLVHDAPPSVSTDTVPFQQGPFDRLVWTPLSRSESAGDASSQLFQSAANDSTQAEALFAVQSPAGDSGYPGALRVEARISITDPSPTTDDLSQLRSSLGASHGRVLVEYRAKILDDDDTKATPLNLTHHWAFNLSASLPHAQREEGRIDTHTLRIFPGAGEQLQRLALDNRAVPTGDLVDAAGPHDWTVAGEGGCGKTIVQNMPEGGYDHFYLWNGASLSPGQEKSTPRALLRAPSSGIGLLFRTNQTGVQLYTANFQPTAPADPAVAGGVRKTIHADAAGERPAYGNPLRSGAFLEFSHPHATFLHSKLQAFAGTDTILRKGDVYDNWTEVEVWKA